MQKLIITIDGRVCSGKSSLIQGLLEKLSQYYGHEIPHYSCGKYYRETLRETLPNELVDDAMIAYVRDIYKNNDVAVIDGRSSNFSLQDGFELADDKKVISVLCDVNKIKQVERIKSRKQKTSLKSIAAELERDRRDKKRCQAKFGKDIFDKQNYDIYLDTTDAPLQENLEYLLSELNKRTGITGQKEALLFAEETETTLSNKMLARKDILPVYLRFSKHWNFSPDYLEKTKDCLSFTVNSDAPFADEVLRFKKWVKDQGLKLEHFCNDSEFLQEKAQTFARAVGLPSLTKEQVLWVRDKVKMKEKLRSIGLPVMNFSPINTRDDILEFTEKYGFPVMFKPRKGFSSINTYKLKNIRDVTRLPVELKPDKFMIEAFNPNKEWVIDGLVQNGTVIDAYTSHIPYSPLQAVVEHKINAHITTPEKPKLFNFEPQEMLQKIISGMELKNGYIHLETFVDKEGNPTICEFGWRMAGCKIPEGHSLAYGFDIYDTLLDIHLGKKVRLNYTPNKRCVGDLYLPNKPGVIEHITPMNELLQHDGALGGDMFVAEGDQVKPRRAGNEASGYVMVEGKTFFNVKHRMHDILRAFKIKTI